MGLRENFGINGDPPVSCRACIEEDSPYKSYGHDFSGGCKRRWGIEMQVAAYLGAK